MWFCLALSIGGSHLWFPDVPGSHWAATAVNRLHQEGLIRGYPGGSFNSPERPTIEERWTRFLVPIRRAGWLVDYPEGLIHHRDEGFSRYEAAVQLYAVIEKCKTQPGAGRYRAEFLGWADEFRAELVSLGVELPEFLDMVRGLGR